MSGFSCHVRNLKTKALSGFRQEKDALAAGGCYLPPDNDGWLDAQGRSGLCVVCENCGSVVEEAKGGDDFSCPVCGESTFRVLQTFRFAEIKKGFSVHWEVPGLTIAIDVPTSARAGMSGIHYTLDGSDPTQSSPVYRAPIPYRREYPPIRVAVFYADHARSQIIEWDYGRAEKNRKQIRKQSKNPKSPSPPSAPVLPPKSPMPKAPAPDSPAPKKEEKNEGCGCIVILAMGIVGGILILNGSGFGWILAIFAVLAGIGKLNDE